MGVKWSLIVGTATSLAARLALVFVTDALTLFAALLLLLPMGVSLTSNVLKLGVRRYTTSTMRSPAFDCSYIVTNSAALTAAFLLTVTRAMVPDFGLPYRPYLLLACIPGFMQLTLTFFLRDASPFELVLSVNPLIVTTFLPLITMLMHGKNYDTYNLLILVGHVIPRYNFSRFPILTFQGTSLSAASMFILGLFKSTAGAVVGVAVFTIGEMIWAPRLLELSVMVGDEGREGTVLALSAIPRRILRLPSAKLLYVLWKSAVYVDCVELKRFMSGRDASHCASGGIVWLYVGGIATKPPSSSTKTIQCLAPSPCWP
ncbi:hypothetical protein Esti_004778 [Eimeria stiedai]